jgi:DNA uptake protein ComE-like DNA-binding protein
MYSPHRLSRVAVALIVALLIAPSLSPANAADQASEPILLQGQLLDTDGNLLPGAMVEIWHTDVNGKYNHPNDAPASALVKDFQYFGTATVAADGYYAFRTLRPAAYESRPPHIHLKVKIGGAEALTSQFYFEEDRAAVQADGVFGSAGDMLFLKTVDGKDADGNPLRIATGNLVLDRNGNAADTLVATPTQAEGPYYPVIDFSGYDNNLTSVAADDAVVLPVLAEVEVAFTLLNLNTATEEELRTIPDMSNRMVREFFEYRPYVSIQQFRREIGKYVSAEQVAAYEKYVFVPIQINDSDAATLQQIPGVTAEIAAQIIAARSFADAAAFLQKLDELLTPEQAAFARNYLVAQ